MKTMTKVAGALGALSMAMVAGHASAATFTYTATGSGGDGPEHAQAVITTGANSITVALTSLIVNPTAAGQEVSGIQITLAGGPSTVVLTSATGQLINMDGSTATNVAGNPTHWGAGLSGGSIFLATAGAGAPGGKPIDLIIGAGNHATDYDNANPSITGRNPQIDGTGNFLLTLTGASSPQITGVKFLFGTGPDNSLTGVCAAGCGAVPEPASWAMLILGFGPAGAAMRRRRLRPVRIRAA
jgi:hypothetical protein